MRAIKTQKGFTIVETLIVLAVTGVMFVATATLIVGQIARASFRESSLNVEQMIADAINDVNSGFLDQASSGGPVPGCNLIAGQAGSSGCMYVGKKYTLDSANSKLVSEALYVLDVDDNPFSAGTTIRALNPIEKDLPSGIDYNNNAEFYVLFERYSDRSNPIQNAGEAQTVALYTGGPGTFTKGSATGILFCGSNGPRDVKYTFGVNGSPSVSKEFTSAGCP